MQRLSTDYRRKADDQKRNECGEAFGRDVYHYLTPVSSGNYKLVTDSPVIEGNDLSPSNSGDRPKQGFSRNHFVVCLNAVPSAQSFWYHCEAKRCKQNSQPQRIRGAIPQGIRKDQNSDPRKEQEHKGIICA
jgi:hypothetical protein